MSAWLVLMVSLPPHPSSLRVRVWRKLRALGAVALKKSVSILPFTPENFEQFQWLSQEVQKARGEATLLRVDQIENLPHADIVRRFQEAREQDYRAFAARYRKIAQSLEAKARGSGRRAGELARLAREVARVREIDFFDAPGGAEVTRLRETIEMRLQPAGAAPLAAITPVASKAPLGTGDESVLIKFYDGESLTADNQECRNLKEYRVIDLEYVVDHGTVNTTTVTLEHTNGAGSSLAVNTTGQTVVSASAADADALNTFDLYGVTTCVDINVVNSNAITWTIYGLARK